MATNTELSEFRFTFEELPLVIDLGFSAGLVTGSAQITYWREDGYTQWTVGRIYLEGHRKATEQERAAGSKMFITRDVEVAWDREADPEGKTFESQLYLTIFGQLDGDASWRDVIEDQVNRRLESEAA
jgi:hypothetical protein